MEERKEYKLRDFMEFNPKVKLAKNTLARKITMDQLVPHCRDIHSWTFEPYTGGTKFENGDTIMARITPCLENGKHAYISCLEKDEVAYGSTEYIVIRGRKDISDNDFVYYLSHFPDFKNAAIKSMVGTSGRQRAQVDVLENLKMFLPPISEQRRIASILSSLDDKIELNRKINANLEAQAQALFKSWFVDFEPFKDQPFVESELGMIPEGWRVCEAQEVFNINIGKTPPRKEPEWFTESKEDNIWVSIADMGNCGVFISDSSEYLTDDAIKRFNVQMIEKDSILLSFKLTVGRVAIAATRMTTNEAIARFLLPDKSYREFLYLYLKQYKYENLGSTSSIATAVNSKTIKGMKLLIPDFAVIERFSRNAKPLFEQIRNSQQESRRLASLRDTLLPRLMSGELKVNEVI